MVTDSFCFAVVESYITHVRITEDAAYPSGPPPPNSPAENKKVRVIIVAVRRSGRVRMHKARENNDGSFSIGKTWMLDDLSSIISYTAFTPSAPAEQQHKQWAGSVGFVVTVGKPYYWHARTSKEKEFFIGSLVKIYRKYTGGKVPSLIGFDDRELHLLVGTPPIGPPGAPRPPMPLPTRPEGPPSSHGSRPQSPYTAAASSRDGSREPPPRRPVPEELSLRAQKSRDQMGRPSTGQSSKMSSSPQTHPAAFPTDQPPPRAPKIPLVPPQAEKKLRDPDETSMASSYVDSQPPPSRDGRAMPEAKPFLRTQELGRSSPDVKRSMDNLRPTTPASAASGSRNFTQSPSSSLGQKSPRSDMKDKAFIPEPLGRSREADGAADAPDIPPVVPAAAPMISPPPLEPEPVVDNAPKPFAGSIATESAHSDAASERALSFDQSEPDQLATDEPEAHRPGLGPMIKKKQNKEVAGAFRKAATAYGAFKPRPGGAGERLMAAVAAQKQKVEADGPDGITGVVPAPSLRPGGEAQTPEGEVPPSISSARETPPLASPALEPPTVEITQAAVEETKATTATTTVADTKKTVQIQEETRDTSRSTVKVPVDERSRSTSPSPHDRNRRRREDNTMKYCQALGIDGSILDGRGVDFDDILTDLGWNGRLGDEKRIEDLEADVRREIGRVEATSWLGNLEQQEGKVEQLAKLIEKTVEECDELDGLLTLYSHELNVSSLFCTVFALWTMLIFLCRL